MEFKKARKYRAGTFFMYKEGDELFAAALVKVSRGRWISYPIDGMNYPQFKTDRNVQANLNDGNLTLVHDPRDKTMGHNILSNPSG